VTVKEKQLTLESEGIGITLLKAHRDHHRKHGEPSHLYRILDLHQHTIGPDLFSTRLTHFPVQPSSSRARLLTALDKNDGGCPAIGETACTHKA
jgi:hypothetical protein